MTSSVWSRNPEEAYTNPYEYGAQEQFVREARALLSELYEGLRRYDSKFVVDDVSTTKAIWMLQLDALDALCDGLDLLETKKHRTVGRLFRDVVEALDLADYFGARTPESERHLAGWYDNEVVPHRVYRQHLRVSVGASQADLRQKYYSRLSKFTHRSYRALLKSYSLGSGNLMVYDGWGSENRRVLPHTIAAYYAILADLISQLAGGLVAGGLLTKELVDEAWSKSLEPWDDWGEFFSERDQDGRID